MLKASRGVLPDLRVGNERLIMDIRPKDLVLHDKANLRKPHSHWDLKRDGHQVVSLSADNASLGKFANLQGLADFLGWQ